MPRPRNLRNVNFTPNATYFKPRGVPLSQLECVELTHEELEALRLTDYLGMYQAQAAEKMNISRQTLGRTVDSARKKIAEALVDGKALSISLTDQVPCPQRPLPGRPDIAPSGPNEEGSGRGRQHRRRKGRG